MDDRRPALVAPGLPDDTDDAVPEDDPDDEDPDDEDDDPDADSDPDSYIGTYVCPNVGWRRLWGRPI